MGLILAMASSSLADVPKPVDILSVSEVPDVMDGQFHYLFLCVNKYNAREDNLSGTSGILVLTIDTNRNEIMFTSILSNELVQRPDGKTGSIVFITKNFGIDALMNVISIHYGIRLDKYVLFDYNEVIRIIDAIGGVDLNLSDSEVAVYKDAPLMNYTLPVKLENGTYHCQGAFIVYYMRRNLLNDEIIKFDRMSAGITVIAERLKSFNPDAKIALLATVLENITITNITMNDCLNILGSVTNMGDYRIKQLQLPQQDDKTAITYNTRYTYEIDFASCRQKVQAFLRGE
jgi:anionic cell wall polymer biosynthesis LytR-Cps2A-Psr (LCP) family protein